jgi:Protein of unknown function (DUF429)
VPVPEESHRDAALIGVDFTCAPSRRKPITVARGRREGAVVELQRVDRLPDLAAFETLLREPGPWLGAFDFPFGLPRVFVESLGLGGTLPGVVAALRARCATRMEFRALVDTWGNGRPQGQRLPHRRTDTAEPGAFTTSPLQTRYVPVGLMFFEGLPRLLDTGVHLPGLADGDRSRVALEGYPGLLAHELIGARSYKNRASDDRRAARGELLDALHEGRGRLGLALLDDDSGDLLDAALCLIQAAWARTQPGYGLPDGVDPVEGWVTTATWPGGP